MVDKHGVVEPITEGEARTHRQRLDPDLTGRLLAAGAARGVGLDRVLLAALAMAVAPWRDATRWRLAVERHGREAPSGVDLTRTVGWFTVSHPLTIELPSLDASPAEALAAARAAFDRVPGDGAGLGILRAHGDAASRARSSERRPSELPEPELLLNVLGRRPVSAIARRLRPLDGAHLGARDPRQPRSHRLELNARVDGDRLQVDWIHVDRDLATSIVDALATRLATALDRMADALAGRSSVDTLGWSADVSARLGESTGIEDVHPLSSAQEALLVHRLQDPEHDSGVVVLRARWRGTVDVERFVEAWRHVVARHPVLRSAVRWRDLPHPVQVVAHAVEVPVAIEDWRDRSPVEQDRAWNEQLDRIRRAGLDLDRAPVLSVVLVRVDEDEYRLAWACHHVLLDGWSSGWVLREVLDRVRGIDLGPPPPRFRDHVAWTRARRPTADEVRAGFDPRRVLDAPRVTGTAWQGGARADRERRVELLVDGSCLADWARRHGVTVASVVLGCWGLVLTEATAAQAAASRTTASRATDGPTAVLGFTAAGRGLDLEGLDADGIDRRIGLFAGVLPLVVTVDPEAAPSAWIGTVFERQQGLQALAPWPLRELFELAGTALRRPPFDTLVAVANFLPSASAQPSGDTGVHLDALRGDVTAALPLTLAVIEDGALAIEARWDDRWLDDGDVAGWLDRLASLVRSLVDDDAPTVRDWLDRAPGRAPSAVRSDDPARAARPLGGTGAEAATTATEAHVMRLWNDLLTVQEYGRDDSFFDLGGHSLAVARMLARIRQDFAVELPLGVVFEQPTVRGVAAAIDARDARRSWTVRVPIRVAGEADDVGDEPPLFMVHGLGGEV
ncbi:MAG: condensation domain-containing protein, partial [Acidobacteriota bacterium]